jgi:hypothetical protein
VAVFIVVGLAKNLQQLDAKGEQAESLEARVTALKQENEQLEHNITALATEEALEAEARGRLNLKKEGEEVVVIVPKEGEPYEPLSDEEFLRLYNQKNEPVSADNGQGDFDAVQWVRSILSGILKGREETIE